MKVIVTGYLAELAGGGELQFNAEDYQDLSLRNFLDSFLFENYSALKPRIINEKGCLREHIAVFVDSSRIRQLDDRLVIDAESEIYILPALSGG